MNIKLKLNNPYFLAVLFCFALMALLLYGNSKCIISNDMFLTLFFGVITILVSIIVAINSHRQSEMQRSNIKLQLFDKRYEVFRVIANSYILITADITDDLIGGKYNNGVVGLHQAIGLAKEDMRLVTLKAQCLFDKSVVSKIEDANSYFSEYCTEYYRFSRTIGASMNESSAIHYYELYSKFICAQGEEREKIESELTRDFPDVFKCLVQINQNAKDAFAKVINSGLFEDFDKDIMIDSIDK